MFELHSVFQRIDRNRSLFISTKEIIQFIYSVTNKNVSESDMYIVISQFSS